jgi:hypothetical protein
LPTRYNFVKLHLTPQRSQSNPTSTRRLRPSPNPTPITNKNTTH